MTKPKPFSTSSKIQLEAVPKFVTPRRPERPTFGPQIAKVARKMGQPLMPWQAEFADVLGEYDPATGNPYYPLVFYTVPRRQGKTLLLFSWCLRRMMTGRRQRVAWSAQSRSDARELWLDELYPLLEETLMAPAVDHLGKSNGGESIKLKNKSIMRLVAPGNKTGHGKLLHASAEDEIFADQDSWRDQAFGPAMLTVDDSQVLKTSTAGTAASTVYNNLRKKGREAAVEDVGEGVCYLEYSADKDWDYLDPNTYWGHMPALGYTTTVAKMKAEIEKMLLDPDEGPDGVCRAFGNRTAGMGSGSEIPEQVWERVCGFDVKPDYSAGLFAALAVSQDLSSSSIAVADKLGRVELVENRGGTAWVVQRANEISAKWGVKVVLDGGGPAGALADSLKNVEALGSKDVYRACGAFFLAVTEDEALSVRKDPALDLSVAGMVKKDIGDKFVWSRTASTEDITPLEAASLAWYMARGKKSIDPLSQIW